MSSDYMMNLTCAEQIKTLQMPLLVQCRATLHSCTSWCPRDRVRKYIVLYLRVSENIFFPLCFLSFSLQHDHQFVREFLGLDELQD